MKVSIRILLLFFCLSASYAMAEKEPKNGTADSRIKQVVYNPYDVVNVTAHYGFSTMIEFGQDEEILTISLGDTIAWTMLDTGNRLFLKPIEEKADTNMQVVTNKRVYNLALIAKKAESHRSSELTFTLKFLYPIEEMKKRQQREKAIAAETKKPSDVVPERTFRADQVNMEYTRKGADEIAPHRVFDDGQFTYFSFNETMPTPAIFAVDSDKNESLVNFQKKGKYIVIQRIAKQFVLRHGAYVTCIFNKDYLAEVDSTLPVEPDTSVVK